MRSVLRRKRMRSVLRTRTWGVLLPFLCVPLPASAQETCRLVAIETGSVHACSSGTGPTTVILAAGAGQTSRTWDSLRSQLATSARVLTFDRAGLGASPPGPPPRTPTRIARELRAVVEALDVSGPLVLVGHSMGGVHVLRYASLYPSDVAGVVILDTPPPGFEEERLTLLTPDEQAERRRLLRAGASRAPEAVRLEREGARPEAEWRFPDFPGSVPLAVVVANAQDFGELGSLAAHRQLWMDRSRQWLSLSERSTLTVAEGSGHMVHHDREELVRALVLSMVAAPGSGLTLPR